ncbi:MAG TPA: TolC family protein [Vicinamibacterales bacterium]|nr:TolC family protein [Vicinamibacterales bacterium]
MSQAHVPTARAVIAGALLLALVPGARGQELPLALTLEEALARARAHSLRLVELQARQEGSAAQVEAREADRRPVASILGGYTRTSHVPEFSVFQPGQGASVIYPDVPDNFRSRIDLQWPIYTGGRLDALERAARAERDASGEELETARADLRLEVTRAFWALVTARETERVLERSLEAIDAHVRDLRARLDQGLIPPNDVLSAEARQSRERLLAIEAANARRVAEADLRRLLGLEGFAPIEPRAVLTPAAPPAADVPRLLVEAREGRAERRALQARIAAAQAREEGAGAGTLPQVAFNAGYDYARPNSRIFPREDTWQDFWDVSINVSWAVWDGGRARASRAEADAARRAAEARAAEFDRTLTFEVQQRLFELESSLAAIPVADDGVRAAAEARRVVGERFNAGVATSTDVLDAQTDLLSADLARTRALANLRIAEARLDRAIGR